MRSWGVVGCCQLWWRLDPISDAEIAYSVAGCACRFSLDSDFDLGCDFFHSCLSLFLYLQRGIAPLLDACGQGHEKIVEVLVKAGAEVDLKDEVRQRLTVPLCLSWSGSRRMKLGGVLWLISVVMGCCRLLSQVSSFLSTIIFHFFALWMTFFAFCSSTGWRDGR